ncbi:phytoene desaturase family protein [Flammeovirga aprica]|uniref:NAD(P)/FAD-dependent oxidoreductase n=1 Tax=Flammeovirga aprica JL-4 TaxID=694437 RepID=A0A7X9P190_9BACT|nr:NAD(P)-binding protein [Flammeovirga aprica]NME66507.1 NAD(P)/FAD-dependent oxidoreductase [Flammeovirga aprica JL-4]
MEREFDIVIIGSGLGGLQCGYILADEGYSVCILEKNRQYGGNLQTFVRDKKIFDTGVHYIGGLDEGQNLNSFFKYFNIMDDLKLQKLDEDAFDLISFGEDENVYPYAQGYDNFIEKLSAYFPEEREAIVHFCDTLRDIVSKFPMYSLKPDKVDDQYFETLQIGLIDYLESITSNKKLQSVLAGNNLLYAGRKESAPLYVHALVLNSYIESSYKCTGGGAQIERLLSKNLKAKGVVMRNYAEVTGFNIEDKLVKSVMINGGEEKVYGKKFISNIPPAVTVNMIDKSFLRKSYIKRINSLPNTPSIFILYGVLKEKTFKNINSNIYHFESDSPWDSINYPEDDFGNGFALFFNKDAKNPEYCDSFSLMTYMNFSEVEQWKDTFHTIPHHRTERDEEYVKFKEEKAAVLFKKLYDRLPEMEGCIQSYTTSTPLSFRDYIGAVEGSLYGIEKDYRNPLRTFIPPQTKVDNLLLTGQNLTLHGILGVTISAFITCSSIVDIEKILEKVNAQTTSN